MSTDRLGHGEEERGRKGRALPHGPHRSVRDGTGPDRQTDRRGEGDSARPWAARLGEKKEEEELGWGPGLAACGAGPEWPRVRFSLLFFFLRKIQNHFKLSFKGI